MCNHPEVKQNPQLYAPYNEETLLVFCGNIIYKWDFLIYMLMVILKQLKHK
jgi:hypothetical protein